MFSLYFTTAIRQLLQPSSIFNSHFSLSLSLSLPLSILHLNLPPTVLHALLVSPSLPHCENRQLDAPVHMPLLIHTALAAYVSSKKRKKREANVYTPWACTSGQNSSSACYTRVAECSSINIYGSRASIYMRASMITGIKRGKPRLPRICTAATTSPLPLYM